MNITITKEMMQAHIRRLTPIPTGEVSEGKPFGVIRCILFDIYGTLFISASGDIGFLESRRENDERLKKLMKSYCIKGEPIDLKEKLVYAIKRKHVESKIMGVDYPEIRIEEIWQEYFDFEDKDSAYRFALEYELIVNPVYPMPHLAETLSAIKKKGLYMGIISNAQFYTPLLFSAFFGQNLSDIGFDADLCLYSFEHGRGKPSPFLYSEAANRLAKIGISPQETLYIGNDMLKDILPAGVIGFQTCLYAGDKRSLRKREGLPEIQGVKPGMIVTDLHELNKIIC